MTLVQGNTNDGGAGTGSDGHRCYVNYSYSQNVGGNYSDVSWEYGVDYGDPNYWNSINNRSVAWTAQVGASVSGVSGSGAGTSDSSTINTSNPGYGGQSHVFWSGTARIVHNSNGQGTIRLNASMGFPSPGYTSSITNHDIVLPNIVRPPSAPTSLTATRVNDGQMNLGWTNNSGTYTAYSSVKVYRSTDGAGYALIATLGVVTSYSDTTTSANHKYQYKVRAENAAGIADSSASSAVYTTPGTPTGLTATKLGNGNIRLDWTNHVGYSEYTVRIEESQDGGGYSELTSVAAGTTTYTHTSPSTLVTHTYRVRARSTTGSLNGSYSSVSNTVTLLATANAPTGLAPSGVARDATDDIVLSWTHNPADGTPQSKRRVQYKVDGGSYNDAVNDSSAVSSYTIAGGTLSNGHTITWRVATAGENGTLSSYSSEASFTTSAVPTATISTPDTTYTSSQLTAEWTYFQAQSSTQATWQATLLDSSDGVIEVRSGTTETSATFVTAVLDSTTYRVSVIVTSAAGLSSEPAESTFAVTYIPPAAVYIEAAYDAPSGTMVLTVTGDGPVEEVTAAIDTVSIQRKIDDGAWTTIATGLVLSTVNEVLTAIVLDTTPTVKGTNAYRAVALSALPSSTMSTEDEVVTSSTWIFLNGGTGFSEIVRMRSAPTLDQDTATDKQLYHFAGRALPVELAGEAIDGSISVSVTLTGESSTEAELHALSRLGGIVCLRDPYGRRLFGSLSGVKTSRTNERTAAASFAVTEVDYDG